MDGPGLIPATAVCDLDQSLGRRRDASIRVTGMGADRLLRVLAVSSFARRLHAAVHHIALQTPPERAVTDGFPAHPGMPLPLAAPVQQSVAGRVVCWKNSTSVDICLSTNVEKSSTIHYPAIEQQLGRQRLGQLKGEKQWT